MEYVCQTKSDPKVRPRKLATQATLGSGDRVWGKMKRLALPPGYLAKNWGTPVIQ